MLRAARGLQGEEVSDVQGSGRLPVTLAVHVDDGSVWAFLTDGRSQARQGRACWSVEPSQTTGPAQAARALAADPGAARTYFEQFLPGPVGQWLRASPPRTLNLQIPAALDAVPWECLHDGRSALGQRFLVVRHLLAPPAEATGAAADDMPEAAPSAPGPLHCVELRADAPALGSSGSGRPRERLLTPDDAQTPEGRGVLLDADLVAACAHDLPWLGASLTSADGLRRRRLVVTLAAEGAPRTTPACSLRDGGSTLVSVTRPLDPPTWAGWLALLRRALEEGRTIEAALRAAHRALPVPWPEGLQVHGPVDVRLRAAGVALPQERGLRQVTTLAFDLADSTPLLRRLGDESYARLLAGIHRQRVGVVQRHGGLSADAQGDDGVLSFFGYPETTGMAARDALAAALEIRDLLIASGVGARIGVATGQVAIHEGQPHGTSLVLAARLQARARPGSVLVAESTQVLARELFAFGPAQALDLKGLDPCAAFELLGPSAASAPAAEAAVTGPFVGRAAERARLAAQWQTSRDGAVRVVLVRGEAGIGKSRLMDEFLGDLREGGTDALELRGHAEAATSPLRAVAQSLRRALGIPGQAAAEAMLAALMAALPPDTPDADVAVIAALLEIPPTPRNPAPTETGAGLRRHTLAALLAWARRVMRRQALCLVVEDLQWVDPSSRELLEELCREAGGARLLVVLTLRDPGPAPALPLTVHETIELKGLTAAESLALVRAAPGLEAMPQALAQQLAARADGVPLFLEESVRSVLERLRSGTQGWEQALTEVPVTLQDVLMSRVDRLGAARRTAQLAAVVGRAFDVETLQALAACLPFELPATAVAAHLRVLLREGVVRPQAGDAAAPRLVFRHGLIRDVAYQSLWAEDRRAAHAAVAGMLGAREADTGGAPPEALAHHEELAGLEAQALAHWEAAAREALARSAYVESLAHLQRALALLRRQPPGRGRDEHELRLVLQQASRAISTAGYGADEVERGYQRAYALAEALGSEPALLKVELGLEAWYFMRADFARAEEHTRLAAARAKASGSALDALQVRWAQANILYHRGEAAAAVPLMDRCLADYQPQMHRRSAVQDPAVMCLGYSAWCRWDLGFADDALARAQRALALADTLEHRLSQAVAHQLLAGVLLFRGAAEPALAHAERSLAICEDAGFLAWRAIARVTRGSVLCELGRSAPGLAELQGGYEDWCATGAVVTRAFCLRALAQGLASSGQPAAALPLLREALDLVRSTGERYHEPEVRRLLGELTLRCGAGSVTAEEEGEHWLLGAHAAATSRHLRAHALRAATTLAAHRMARGQTGPARDVLEPPLRALTEGARTPDVLRARQLLDTLTHQGA
jgi:predicted ATPase/class 3 adenylate cyclase